MYRLILIGSVIGSLFALMAGSACAADDSAKAAETRKKLKTKVTVDYKDDRLEAIVDDIKDQVKGLSIRLDAKGGVSKNRKLTYKAKDKPLDEVLDEMFKNQELGYIVISNEKDAYDGGLMIRVGKERGFPTEKDK